MIPNPWDAGSARVLAALGFEALATTSSGFAFTLGRPDGGATLEEVVAHVAALDEATDLPLSVDLENGYGPDPASVARAITAIADAGAVGGSIEDYDPAADRIYELGEAVERVAAAVEAARSLGFPFMLTARAENHIRGNPDLADTIERLQAFERAGADVLYAPGLSTVDDVATVCAAVSKPVNVLARPEPLVCRPRGRGRAESERRRRPHLGRRPRDGGRGRSDSRPRRLLRAGREIAALARRLIDQDRDAVADDLRVDEAQRLLVARLAEEALARAEHDREDHQPKLVDEVVLDQRLHELHAAVHDDVAVHLLLELRDLLGEVAARAPSSCSTSGPSASRRRRTSASR